MKTAVADAESPEWWHDLMTRPWTFTIKFESTAGQIEVGAGVEFKSGLVVVEINERVEHYKSKAAMLEQYKEPTYVIEWHQE